MSDREFIIIVPVCWVAKWGVPVVMPAVVFFSFLADLLLYRASMRKQVRVVLFVLLFPLGVLIIWSAVNALGGPSVVQEAYRIIGGTSPISK